MTGYGIGEHTEGSITISVEIKTVNHRYCDIVTRIPRHISYLEEQVKSNIKSKVDRGRIEVYINIDEFGQDDVEVQVDEKLAHAYLKAVEDLGRKIGIYSDITMDRFLDFPDVLKPVKKEYDQEEIWNICREALNTSLDKLDAARSREGEVLAGNMESKLSSIENMITEIERYKDEMVTEYREKLSKRIAEILEDRGAVDSNKLENEIAYFADKSNVDEEIVRLNSHIGLFRHTAASEGSIGKKLDFIVQEMNRETNTIGSKAGNTEILNRVVEIKTKIEEIREQIQNIE